VEEAKNHLNQSILETIQSYWKGRKANSGCSELISQLSGYTGMLFAASILPLGTLKTIVAIFVKRLTSHDLDVLPCMRAMLSGADEMFPLKDLLKRDYRMTIFSSLRQYRASSLSVGRRFSLQQVSAARTDLEAVMKSLE